MLRTEHPYQLPWPGCRLREDLLKRVSEAAGGRFYYIESPDHAPEVFKEELGGLLDTVTQNVEVSSTSPMA